MSRMVEVKTPLEALLVEQALAMAQELQAVAQAAPDGQVLAHAELAAVRRGRELTRQALEATLQLQAESAEKQGPPAEPALVVAVATSKRRRPRPS